MINSNDYYKKKYLKYKEKYLKYKEKNSLQQHGGSIATLATITFVCFMYIYSNTTQIVEIVELRSSKPPTLSAFEQLLKRGQFGVIRMPSPKQDFGFVNNNLLLQDNVAEIFESMININSEIPSNPNNVLVCTNPSDPSDKVIGLSKPSMTCKTDNPSNSNLFKYLAPHPHKTVVITRDGFPSGIKYHVFEMMDFNRTNIRIESILPVIGRLNQVTEPTNHPFISTFPNKISEVGSYWSSEVGNNLNVQLKKAGSSAISNTASAISNTASAISNTASAISKTASEIGNAGSSAISNTASAISKTASAISKTASEIGNAGSSAISNTASALLKDARSALSKDAAIEVLSNMDLAASFDKIKKIGENVFFPLSLFRKGKVEVESNRNLDDDEEVNKVVTKKDRIIDAIKSMPGANIIKNPFLYSETETETETETHWVTTTIYPDHYLVIYHAAFNNKQQSTKSVCIFQESDELILCSVEKTVQSRKTFGNLLDGIYTTMESLFSYLGIIKRLPKYLIFGGSTNIDMCELPMIELFSKTTTRRKLEEIRKDALEICRRENQPKSPIDRDGDGDSFFSEFENKD